MNVFERPTRWFAKHVLGEEWSSSKKEIAKKKPIQNPTLPFDLKSIFEWLLLAKALGYTSTPKGKEFLSWYQNYRPIRRRSHTFFWH